MWAAMAACLATGLLSSSLAGQAVPAQDGAAQRTVWDRVYTEVQAGRGATLYGRYCESCHGSGLDGDAASEIPALVSDPFFQRWSGRNLDDFFTRLARTMPQETPGSLRPGEYADLVAYLLQTNGFPAGFEALGTDSARLKALLITRQAR
jgi:mono/diheme cytochrome c family protein